MSKLSWLEQHAYDLRNAIAATDESITSDEQILAQPGKMKERIAKLEERNAQLEKELDAGDSWAWIRAKFERSKDKFRWYHPRTDELIGTRYEVMGWLHCLFADADPTVFIDITLEHQKRTDEAEAELRELISQRKGITL